MCETFHSNPVASIYSLPVECDIFPYIYRMAFFFFITGKNVSVFINLLFDLRERERERERKKERERRGKCWQRIETGHIDLYRAALHTADANRRGNYSRPIKSAGEFRESARQRRLKIEGLNNCDLQCS